MLVTAIEWEWCIPFDDVGMGRTCWFRNNFSFEIKGNSPFQKPVVKFKKSILFHIQGSCEASLQRTSPYEIENLDFQYLQWFSFYR